ncbi:MAG: Fic family protein [Succinivibrio sp.]|nr:Fic family protein [Succinivibrio sp.]
MPIQADLALFQKIMSDLDVIQREQYLSSFSYQFTHNSTALEGNTVSYYETVTLINDGITPAGKTIRECHEIIGHDKAVRKMIALGTTGKGQVSEDIIREFHQLCMYPAQYAGVYRNTQAYIRGARTKVDPPQKIYEDMKFLIEDLNNKEFKGLLKKAAYAHAEFVRIHPFSDADGRTARLLMNYILLTGNYPMICIDKTRRAEYIEALDAYGVTGDLQPFYAFLSSCLQAELKKFFDLFDEIYTNYVKLPKFGAQNYLTE